MTKQALQVGAGRVSDKEMCASASSSRRVCVRTVCGGVSLLSITSSLHKSDVTFPQDQKLPEVEGGWRKKGVTAWGL